MDESIYHLLYIIAYLSVIGICVMAPRSAMQPASSGLCENSKFQQAARAGYVALMLIYALKPGILSWATVALPGWLRSVGVLLALVAIPLLYWVQLSLSDNFPAASRIDQRSMLALRGPYRWVRYPLYTVLTIFSIGLALLAANWFVGAPMALVIVVSMAGRIQHEEAAMIERFGDSYREYMARTGRFLPRLLGPDHCLVGESR